MEDAASAGERSTYTPVKLPPSAACPRPHRCDICQRSFRELATLRKHEQLHRADRPYVCQTCGKSFLWSSNLKVHERVHTGERPYKCKICHRCFTQSNDLRRHERNVHMRGKIYGYKHGPVGAGRGVPASGVGSHVNLAAYQAFAMQQRALLQQALTYESYLHTASVSQAQMFSQPPPAPLVPTKTSEGVPMCLPGSTSTCSVTSAVPERRDIRRSPIKLEQVTPPSTPGDSEGGHGDKRAVTATPSHVSDSVHSPAGSRYPAMSGPTPMAAHSPLHSPPALISVGGQYQRKENHAPVHQSPHHSPHHMSPHAPSGPLPSFSSFRQLPRSSSEYETEQGHTPNSISMMENMRGVDGEDERDKYPCDSVMDLSINKTPESSLDKLRRDRNMPTPKTPSSESECEGKRDVTTTSATPVADNGIHHCQHCNIFFYDYTMYHLHESLHLPYADYPFRCPSCGKHCQDRIEFMFHTVWHVKYPHTIPNYQPFKESFIS
ncbi:hypothetical protein C0Q70_07923 [Pomacea canaliculata]|uniref:C2H2-type domain-containing protein n=2 Tax=Pomacea canaliculata TaxID=400727 RepID=A0A2T7PGE9_POMCA|nr:zinc finger protein 628-like isoform X2 [Pomacea canaliculata]XP_025092382.1 zinc finger protein 628-like isoform X2 [Pomacea canaliculata]XP_025092383.1 zinc finger protein 628-like isoform X2 [Pomacea canaliculata]PVD32484.1 hypothetical protein C0Q70_07923 [Pomacea canaliculata]